MRILVTAIVMALAIFPAAAQDFPQSPKAGPPSSLPDAPCDATHADNGDWLLGRWVGPQTKFDFVRQGTDITWVMDRKNSAGEFGWQEGAIINGKVTAVTTCTLRMSAGDDDFVFEGVLTQDGLLYGAAVNKAGRDVRFTLRRAR